MGADSSAPENIYSKILHFNEKRLYWGSVVRVPFMLHGAKRFHCMSHGKKPLENYCSNTYFPSNTQFDIQLVQTS